MKRVGFATTASVLEPKDAIVDKNFTHALATGETGSGKTSCFILPNVADRIVSGYGMIFFDYKGKEHKTIKLLAKQASRLNDVVEFGTPWGFAFDLASELTIDEMFDLLDKPSKDAHIDSFWVDAAKSLLSDLVNTVIKYNQLAKLLKYDKIELSFAKIGSICNSGDSFTSFVKVSLPELEPEQVAPWIDGDDGERVAKLFFDYQECRRVMQEFAKNLPRERFSQSSGNGGVLLALKHGFGAIEKHSYLNTPSKTTLIDALNSGKIVVINAKNLTTNATKVLFGYLISRLVDRAGKENLIPISIVADEAQRILTADLDLGDDVLRESSVELLLATQNIAQLERVVGKIRLEGLLTNLTSKYLFRSQQQHYASIDQYETENLAQFEYFKQGELEKRKATPLFVDKKAIELAENSYQRSLESLKFVKLKAGEVVIADSRSYQKEGVYKVVDTNGKAVREVYMIDPANPNHYRAKLQEMIRIDDFDRNGYHMEERHYDDDFYDPFADQSEDF